MKISEAYRRMQCEGKIGLSSGATFPLSKKRLEYIYDHTVDGRVEYVCACSTNLTI